MTYAYIYDREVGSLPLSEAEALFLTGGKIVTSGVVVGDVRVDWGSSGYLRDGGELIAHATTVEDLCQQVTEKQIEAIEFKVISESIPRKREGDFRALLAVAECIGGQANLRNPKTIFHLVVSEDGYWLIKSDPAIDRSWLEYKHKPFPFCNALPVRIGRAVLNLCAQKGDKVFDPCCGSGTIPMLASNMGMIALAGDKSWPNLNISKQNIAHFGCSVEIKQEDATETTRSANCIFTNLPYDLYLPLAEDVLRSILKNFQKLAPKVVLITTMDLTDRLLECDYTIEQKLIVTRNNLERNIYILSHS